MNNNQLICTNCGHVGQGKKAIKGSILVELLLLFIVIVAWLFTPRIIMPVTVTISVLAMIGYSVYRLTSKKTICEKCGHASLIPLDTPVGQKLMKENAGGNSGAVDNK